MQTMRQNVLKTKRTGYSLANWKLSFEENLKKQHSSAMFANPDHCNTANVAPQRKHLNRVSSCSWNSLGWSHFGCGSTPNIVVAL